MPETSLAGRGIVVTRPAEQAAPLIRLIEEAGGTACSFPLLAIAPLDDYSSFDHILAGLAACDWAIFISSNAVQHSMPRVLHRYPSLPPGLRFAAIGPATAEALRQYGVATVLTPVSRFDSESLLALPEMQAVHGQRCMIFRGVGGRELLAESLQARGAEVSCAESYRRINPQRDTGNLPELWQNKQLHAIVVTSSEALRNLLQLAENAPWLKDVLVCVNHARIAEQAQQHGLRIAAADAPGDDAMLACLIQHLRDRTKT